MEKQRGHLFTFFFRARMYVALVLKVTTFIHSGSLRADTKPEIYPILFVCSMLCYVDLYSFMSEVLVENIILRNPISICVISANHAVN